MDDLTNNEKVLIGELLHAERHRMRNEIIHRPLREQTITSALAKIEAPMKEGTQ